MTKVTDRFSNLKDFFCDGLRSERMQISCLDIYIRGWHFKLWNKVVNWINQPSSTLLFAGKSISDRHEEQHLRRRQLRKIRWVKNPWALNEWRFRRQKYKVFWPTFSDEHLNLPLLRCIMLLKINGKSLDFGNYAQGLSITALNMVSSFWCI